MTDRPMQPPQYCDMTPERRKCAVREAPQKMSIARQRLARHVSAATDRLVETKRCYKIKHTFPWRCIPGDRLGTERVSVSTNIQQTCS
jgi:hypothetical protein